MQIVIIEILFIIISFMLFLLTDDREVKIPLLTVMIILGISVIKQMFF